MNEKKEHTCEDDSYLIFKEFHSAAVHQMACVHFPNCCLANFHKCSGLRQDSSSLSFHGLQALASVTGLCFMPHRAAVRVHQVSINSWVFWLWGVHVYVRVCDGSTWGTEMSWQKQTFAVLRCTGVCQQLKNAPDTKRQMDSCVTKDPGQKSAVTEYLWRCFMGVF